MKRLNLMVLLLLIPAALFAQAPAPRPPATAATAKLAVIDMRRAMTESTDGKKAADQWVGEMTKRQGEFDKLQKEVQDLQSRLSAQSAALSETARADLTRQIDQKTTDLNRTNEDAQKDLGELQQKLLQPIAVVTNTILRTYAVENGFAVVFDRSSEFNSILYWDDIVDITTEIIRRVDAETAKAARP
jgi:Skp family chaperone for outer membrane proteins